MSSHKYVVLGGGMVAGYAAKELATRGLGSGELVIISSDDALPYERPALSKGFLAGKENETGILINPSQWYVDQGIDIKLRTTVEELDLHTKRLRANTEETFEFDNLLIATGAEPRTLRCPGADLSDVFYLRSMDDSRKIRAAAAGSKRAVVIGSGFIGMEVASVLAQKKIQTTLVIREDRVWPRVFTPPMSEFFERYYTSHGVRLVKQQSVTRLDGKGHVEHAVLSSGETIGCDMVVAGIGVTPVTRLLEKSGLPVDNGIVVDEYLATNAPGVSAAGDVANYFDKIFEKRRRVEHWDNAVSQGQHWARVVTGDRQPFMHVPYFFSDVFDLSYELWGDSESATQTVVRGDVNSSSFSVWWLRQGRVVCAFAMNRPDDERQVAPEWIQSKETVSPERLGDEKRSIQEALAT